MSKAFAEYLRGQRGNMTLREFARLLHISHTQLASLEQAYEPRTGRPPNITVNLLLKIAHALDTDIATLARYFEGTETFTRRWYSRPSNQFSPKEKQSILDDLEKFGSISAVALKHNIKPRTISVLRSNSYTKEEREAIINEYKNGFDSIKAICEKYMISSITFYNWLSPENSTRFKQEVLDFYDKCKDIHLTSAEFNVPVKQIRTWKRNIYTPEYRAQIVAETYTSPINEVAKKYDLSLGTLYAWRKKVAKNEEENKETT